MNGCVIISKIKDKAAPYAVIANDGIATLFVYLPPGLNAGHSTNPVRAFMSWSQPTAWLSVPSLAVSTGQWRGLCKILHTEMGEGVWSACLRKDKKVAHHGSSMSLFYFLTISGIKFQGFLGGTGCSIQLVDATPPTQCRQGVHPTLDSSSTGVIFAIIAINHKREQQVLTTKQLSPVRIF